MGTMNSTNNIGFPKLVQVSPFNTPVSHTNWNSVFIDTTYVKNGYLLSSGAQNDEASYDAVLVSGTWTIEWLTTKGVNRGIYTLSLDGTDVGTADGYAASTTVNVLLNVVSIVVATSGKKRLRFKMATKNGSSSAYYGVLQGIYLRRTGD